jgi:SHS family lactate transporter-like MFS transporter
LNLLLNLLPGPLRELTVSQRHAVAACYLGWMLDAFDFFILVFVLKDIAAEFTTDVKAVTLAITLTLAMRPVGAFLFGALADKYGRRPVLMINVLIYSLLELASGFAPSLAALITLRALYGIAMGGEWGVGASLTLETVPAKTRGLISGILQAGYPSGYLLASLLFNYLFPVIGWRGMFMVGVAPALLVLYIRRSVDESPAFIAGQHAPRSNLFVAVKNNLGLFLWAVMMMACFNFLSHGTQDMYPTFLLQNRGLSTHQVSMIAVVYNIGAILGGITFGVWSNKAGRRKAIVIAALCALPVIPLWVMGSTPVWLALGAFLMQFFVQGAWGVVPAHLNELSPDSVRGVFPGFVYQLGNLLASYNATLQAGIAAAHSGDQAILQPGLAVDKGDYAFALASVVATVAILLAVIAGFGREARGKNF